jgi:hypothetical protein
MEDSVGVEEYERLQDLPEEALALSWRQSLSHLLHILLEVEFEIFENKE